MTEQTASEPHQGVAVGVAPISSGTPDHSQPSHPDTWAADRAWVRRWGELREWRIIVFIVVPLAPVLGLLVGGQIGWLVAFGAPLGALARLYAIRCPECRSRFAERRLTPVPSACAVCGTPFGDTLTRRNAATSSSTARTTSPALPEPADELARRLARWNALRKQLAAVQIATCAFGIVALLDAFGQTRGEGGLVVAGMLLAFALAALGGLLLWHDRTGGVPVSLGYYMLQIVLFRFDAAHLWIVLGPYALVIVGPDGFNTTLGFTYGFAGVPSLGQPSDWVGVNVLALAAFWFLWRRPWREMLVLSVIHDAGPMAATPVTEE